MKTKLTPKIVAMMAACALVASIGNARAQGMPEAAQQLVQTMRPMNTPRTAPQADAATSDATHDEHAYGGTKSGTSMSAGGRSADGCRGQPRCDVFFGQ